MTKLIKSKFEAWLRAKPPTEIVGENRDCHACPIAKFFCDTNGGWEIVISGHPNGGYVADRGSGDRRLPTWAENFILKVDRDDGRRISASRALEICAQC